MFGFFDKAEKTIENQVAELKEDLKKILDNDGNVRPGVTGGQVRSAIATVKGVIESYNKISNSANELVDDYQQLEKDKAKLRDKFKKQGIEDVLKRMPMASAIMGYR